MRLLLGLLVVAALVAQDAPPPERYPGSNEHRQPPDGWTCEPQNYSLSVPPEHACSCERMCDETTGKVLEDKACGSWCWPAACKCPIGHSDACK